MIKETELTQKEIEDFIHKAVEEKLPEAPENSLVKLFQKLKSKSEEKQAPRFEMKDDLYQKIGLDSLDKVELVFEIEAQYNIDLPEEMVENVKTPSDFVDLVCLMKQIEIKPRRMSRIQRKSLYERQRGI